MHFHSYQNPLQLKPSQTTIAAITTTTSSAPCFYDHRNVSHQYREGSYLSHRIDHRAVLRSYSRKTSDDDNNRPKNNQFGEKSTARGSYNSGIIYKDDCFGFITFLAGIAVSDYIFAGTFVALSLLADILTGFGVLLADTKRPTIVDRRIPGCVSIIMIALSLVIDYNNNTSPSDGLLSYYEQHDLTTARMIQFALCSFSIVTAFLDLRWRDRFDYPSEFN